MSNADIFTLPIVQGDSLQGFCLQSLYSYRPTSIQNPALEPEPSRSYYPDHCTGVAGNTDISPGLIARVRSKSLKDDKSPCSCSLPQQVSFVQMPNSSVACRLTLINNLTGLPPKSSSEKARILCETEFVVQTLSTKLYRVLSISGFKSLIKQVFPATARLASANSTCMSDP